MKVTRHVERLLRQGKKPRELVESGFPKFVVTRVRTRLREEKAAQRGKAGKGANRERGLTRPSAVPGDNVVGTPEKLASVDSNLKALQQRIEALEEAKTNTVSLDDLDACLDGTLGLGLRDRFKCDCGASGFVALRIQCTKCGEEARWGWFPEE